MLKNVSWISFRNPYLYPQFMRVKFIYTGEVFTANTNEELVDNLLRNSFRMEDSLFELMKSYARRAVNMFNHDIRFTSIDDFVEDLKSHNHIKIIEE